MLFLYELASSTWNQTCKWQHLFPSLSDLGAGGLSKELAAPFKWMIFKLRLLWQLYFVSSFLAGPTLNFAHLETGVLGLSVYSWLKLSRTLEWQVWRSFLVSFRNYIDLEPINHMTSLVWESPVKTQPLGSHSPKFWFWSPRSWVCTLNQLPADQCPPLSSSFRTILFIGLKRAGAHLIFQSSYRTTWEISCEPLKLSWLETVHSNVLCKRANVTRRWENLCSSYSRLGGLLVHLFWHSHFPQVWKVLIWTRPEKVCGPNAWPLWSFQTVHSLVKD